jgi:hypothetical protein
MFCILGRAIYTLPLLGSLPPYLRKTSPRTSYGSPVLKPNPHLRPAGRSLRYRSQGYLTMIHYFLPVYWTQSLLSHSHDINTARLRSYADAQFFINNRYVHREPMILLLSVDASHIWKRLCNFMTTRVIEFCIWGNSDIMIAFVTSRWGLV